MSKFYAFIVTVVIVIGSLINPLSNVRIGNTMINIPKDTYVTTVGHVERTLPDNKVMVFDKGLYVYYKPLHVGFETPHIRWERES